MDRLRILLVEDDEFVAKALCRLLLRAADVVHVGDVSSALDALAQVPDYHLILCDLRLGSARGTDLYLIVRERSPEYLERIAFMSGLGDAPAELEAFRHVPCLGKPLHLDTALALAEKGRIALSGS